MRSTLEVCQEEIFGVQKKTSEQDKKFVPEHCALDKQGQNYIELFDYIIKYVWQNPRTILH